MSKKIIYWGLGLLALIILLIIAWQSPTQQTSTPAPTAMEIVRVGYREHVAYWPLFVGIEKGFFAEQNIKIEKVPFTSTNQLMEALLSGKIDAALGGVNTTLLATLESKSPGEFKIFTITTETKDKPFSQIIVRKDSDINSIVQLAGKKVSTQHGSTTKFLFKKTISEKIAPAEAELEQMEADLQLSSLEAKQTDAAIVFEPTATIGESQGISRAIATSLWANIFMDNFPLSASVVSQRFLQEKPELAKRFIEASNQAITYGEKNEREVQAAIAMHTPLTIDLAEKVPVLDNYLLNEIDREQLQKLFDILLTEGEIKSKIVAQNMLLEPYDKSP